jgi:hypothetical protein
MIKSLRVAFMAALLLALTTPAARAQPPIGLAVAGADGEVRVVNNHMYRIRVVLVDADGRHIPLGRVAPSKAEIFTLDANEMAAGPVQVKVFADEPVWSAGNTGEAIRSQDLFLRAGTAVHVWVEKDLTRTQITMTG